MSRGWKGGAGGGWGAGLKHPWKSDAEISVHPGGGLHFQGLKWKEGRLDMKDVPAHQGNVCGFECRRLMRLSFAFRGSVSLKRGPGQLARSHDFGAETPSLISNSSYVHLAHR